MIIDGQIPGRFVWKDDQCVAILDIAPNAPGHTLVVPRAEIDHWLDLPEDLATHLNTVARTIGAAQREAFNADRVGLVIAGFEVPHVHLHVIPATSMADVVFAHKADASEAALDDAANKLRDGLRRQGAPGVSD
jgi:histidine triad (HIT) family protein